MGHADLVLVTGLSGFVAKHVACRLLSAGYRVRGTVRSARKGEEARQALANAGVDISALQIVQADLSGDAGWNDAAEGCRYVQHTASPFPTTPPREKYALVPAARDGTLRVVKAARRAGVERLVLTSSVVAIYHGHDGVSQKLFTEADVSNVEAAHISSYAVSKTLAEKAAWEAVEDGRMELSVINPSLVLGPLLDRTSGTSVNIVAMMMWGLLPVVPNARFGIVDVRDVAEAHLAAMERPAAAGRRFIVSSGARSLLEIGQALREAYPKHRRALPRWTIPNAGVRFAGRFSRRAKLLLAELDPERELDSRAAREVLGIHFRPPQDAIQASADSLIHFGLVGSP